MKKTKSFSGKFLKTFLLLLIPVLVVTTIYIFKAKAQTGDVETISTYVTVGNSAPTFNTGPEESVPTSDPLVFTTSTDTNPTAIGTTITFNANATDPNGEPYYFIVCSTNAIVKGTSGNAPSCAAGATPYCATPVPSQASGADASCSYQTVSGNAWSNPWYAFVCDNNASSECTMSQGTGGSGSPFFVNHPPTFSAIAIDPSSATVNPGATVTWTATASDTDDPLPLNPSDSNLLQDPNATSRVRLLVCKSNTPPTNGECAGGASQRWCWSPDKGIAANPSCSYSVPKPNAAGSNNAYAFVIDNFNLLASNTPRNAHFTVNNVAPTVTDVSLHGGSNEITLAESTTQPVAITATVSDDNGCSTLSNVKAYVYRSGIGYSGCDATATPNGNYCYPELSCSTSNCSGTTADYTCTANMQYYADPTDTGSKFASENWLATVKATDGGSLTGSAQTTTGVEVKKLIAFSISPNNITYGNVGAGVSIPLTIALTTRATGNVGINQTHHADSQTPYMCTNYSSCTGGTPISITKQQYSMTSGTAYGSGTSLSTSPATVLLKIKKPISSTAQQKNTYWGIEVPSGTVAGSYQGQNIITAVMSATSDW